MIANMGGMWERDQVSLDFLVLGRSFGLSVWQAQKLWERLTDDPRYHLASDPERWLSTAFRQEAAAIGSTEGVYEAPQSNQQERSMPYGNVAGKQSLVEESQRLWPRPATGTRPPKPDVAIGNAPVASELPYRAEVEELLGANLDDVRAYTHQDALLSPHGARAAAFRGGIAFAGAPTKDVVVHEAVHTLQLKTRGATRDATAAEAQAEHAARAVAQGARRIAISYVPTAAVSFDKGSANAGSLTPEARFSNGVRRLDRNKVIFLGATNPELWNWLQVSEPDATAAEVAALLIDELPWAVKGSGVGSTWTWAITPKANGQFEVNAFVAQQFPTLVDYQPSKVDQASKTNKEMEDTVTTGGFIDGDVKVAKDARASRERGRDFLAHRLDAMIHEAQMLAALPQDYEVADGVASSPEYTTGFNGEAFHRAVRAKMVEYLNKASAAGLRKLLEPADIERAVIEVIPTRSRDWYGRRETAEVAEFVGEMLHDATVKALDRLVPRMIAATLANPDRDLQRSDVPHHGYLDIMVLNVLLDEPSPLTVVRTVKKIAADNKAAAKLAKAEKRRLKKLDYGGLRRMLDLTLVRVNSARELSAPWVVPISQDLLEWVAKHQDHIAGMPEATVRDLVPVIEDQYGIVRDAYLGLEAIAKSHAKPGSFDEAKQTPEYDAMYQYAMAISESASADKADRHLGNAKALHQKLSVTAVAYRVRAARTAMAQAPLGENEGVANPSKIHWNAQQRAEADAWESGQAVVAGEITDNAQLTAAAVAASEREALHRLRGIVRKLQQLGEVADTVDSTDALRILLAVSKPVNQTRVALEQALANAARDYKIADGTETAKTTWFTQRQEAVVKANEALAAVVKEHDLESVFARAQSEIKDAQMRKIITELIAMFALGLVTGGIATAVGGLARGMMLARTARGMYVVGEAVEVIGGGGYVMAQLAGGFAALGTDVTLMSLGQSALTGQSLRESLKQNLIGSSVMALAMKPFGFIAQDLKNLNAGLAAKGTVLTMEVIASSAANFAATQLQAAGTASEPELFDWLTQGGMMVVGKAVGTRLAATHTRLAKLGEAAGMRKLAPLRELANQIGRGNNIESLPKLVDGEREVLAIEAEAIARARTTETLSADDVAAIAADNQAAAADIASEQVAMTLWAARGLEPLSGDGSHWYGTREQIRGAIADAGVADSQVIRQTATDIDVRINGQDVRFTFGLPHRRPSRTQSHTVQHTAQAKHDHALAREQAHPRKPSNSRAQAEAAEQARLAEYRAGADHVRGPDKLPSKGVVDVMNAQLQNVKVADIDAIVSKYPADQQARVRTVLARSSGFAKMEGLNALRSAMEPHLKSGKKLYTPGQGSLADNMYYLDGEKHSFDTTHANLTTPQTTPVVEPHSIVILDQVVLAKMTDPKTGKEFAKSLVVNQVVLLEPRGFVDGNNMYNARSPEKIAERADAVLQRATEIEVEHHLSFDEAVGRALDETSNSAIQNQDPVVAAGLKAKLEVIDPAAHADVNSVAIADQVNSAGQLSEAQLEASLAKVPEADRPYLRELLAQQAEIFSPRRQANELAIQGQRILDLASTQGIAKDKVFYLIPKPEKSYGMVAMAHREATGTPVEHYIEGPDGLRNAIASGQIDDMSMLVILDDVAGSGDSLVTATTIAMNNGFRGKLAVSPMVSTGIANTVFNGPSGVASSNPNVAYVPGRIAPALAETAYYKHLTPDQQDHLEDNLLRNLGYYKNGLSTVFPYMAPDNNNQFFGAEIAREYVINRNNDIKAVKTSVPWKPSKAKDGNI